MLDTTKIKKDFPIFSGKGGKNLVYLDSSATSQTPKVVLDTMCSYYKSFRSNIHRGQYPLAEKADKEYENSRKTVAQFLGVEPREVVFTSGATGSANMIVYALENSDIFHEGDEIVTTIMEHHSVTVPMQELAKRKKLKLSFIPMTAEMELDYDAAEKLITKKTKLVMFVGVSNVTGTINDMKRICEIARKNGAYSVIDATQGTGHMPINFKEINCDFAFFSGHKMCGPTGIGVLFGKKELLEKIEPGFFGGGMIDSVSTEHTEWAMVPHKFEAGTPNIGGVIGLGAAVQYLESVGMEKIHKHIEEITKYAIVKLQKMKGVTLYCQLDPKKNIGVISFLIDGVHPHDSSEIFSRLDIATRAGHHCAQPLVKSMKVAAVNRASLYLYSTKEDIDALIAGIKEVQKVFKV